jgi:cyclase
MGMNSRRRQVLQGLAGVAAMVGAGYTVPAVAAGARVQRDPLRGVLTLLRGSGGNVVACSGPDGVLLVDGGDQAGAVGLLAEAEREAPVRVLFNTHWHWDQTGANERLGRRGGVRIIAHENTRLWLRRPVDVRWEQRVYPASPEAAWPTETFHTAGELRFGGEDIGYGYLGQAHTDGDLYVHFRGANVLVVGDVAAAGRYPLMDWNSGGWIGGLLDASQALLKLADDQTVIVPGQGAPITKARLQAQADMLEVLKERIWQLMRKGYSDTDIVAARPTQEYDADWGDPRLFLLGAYRGLWGHVREQRGVV